MSVSPERRKSTKSRLAVNDQLAPGQSDGCVLRTGSVLRMLFCAMPMTRFIQRFPVLGTQVTRTIREFDFAQ